MWLCPNCRAEAIFCDRRRPWPPDWICPACQRCVTLREGFVSLAPEMIATSTTYDPKLFTCLLTFEESNFWFVNRARLIVALMRKWFGGADNFLEIGCGTGSVLLAVRKAFRQLQLLGTEQYPSGLVFARQRLDTDVTLLQMDARAIPAREEFDVIGAFDVLEHIPDDEDVLAQIRTALKPGGGAIISVPQHPWLWSPADDAACHQRRYSRGELKTKLERAGLRVLESTSFNALLLPVMIGSRAIMRARARGGGRPDPMSEFNIGRFSNRILSSVLRLEVALTSVGIRWPLGGSRLVVARRCS